MWTFLIGSKLVRMFGGILVVVGAFWLWGEINYRNGRADVVGAARAGHAHFRLGVIADDGRVQIAVHVDLRAADEAVLDEAALRGFHDVADRRGLQRLVEGAHVAHGQRQFFQHRADAAELEHRHQVGRVNLLRQRRGQHGDARADEGHRVVFDQPRAQADQQFFGAVFHAHLTPPFR